MAEHYECYRGRCTEGGSHAPGCRLARAEAAETEAIRLREALERIASGNDSYGAAVARAREALAGR